MFRDALFRPRHTLLALCLGTVACAAGAASPGDLLRGAEAQAGAAGDAARGAAFFTALHGGEWRCSTCHGSVPNRAGQHAATGKAIAPLAPAVRPERLTDPAKVEKWLRRNCRDVASRECTAAEKADILAFLISVQP